MPQIQDATNAEPTGLRLGEGEFPPDLDRVNFGALLLAFIWAPSHGLWGWFGVFAVLEALESVIGLNVRLLGGAFEQPVAMIAFRIVYWTVTVAFALQANRLVWADERGRAAGAKNGTAPKPGFLVAKYVSNQRVWTWVGLVLLAGAPLSLLIGSVNRIPGAAADVLATFATQAVLLAGLFVYDRMRIARRRG